MDKCILCGMESGIDWHHTVPRAYGGENSEQVPLCSGHHTQVHNMALALYKTGDEGLLAEPQDIYPDTWPRMLVLIRTIVLARQRYEMAKKTQPELQRGKVVINTDAKMNHKLERLKTILNLGSKEAVMKVALDRLYQSQTQRAKK